MKLTTTEHIKGAAYTAITMMESVKAGDIAYDKAKAIVLKWMNFGMPEGETYDMKEYFKKDVSGHGPIMVDEKLRKEMSEDAWNAFCFFDII